MGETYGQAVSKESSALDIFSIGYYESQSGAIQQISRKHLAISKLRYPRFQGRSTKTCGPGGCLLCSGGINYAHGGIARSSMTAPLVWGSCYLIRRLSETTTFLFNAQASISLLFCSG